MPNVNGPLPLIPSSALFLLPAMSIFQRPMLSLDVLKWVSTHSGMFTMTCAMLWMRMFCSSLALVHSMKRVCPIIWTLTQINCHFLIFSPVNLAKVEFHLAKLVRKLQVWQCLKSVLCINTSTHIHVKGLPLVNFTDNDNDELF
jgi:hypothetical protein